MNFESKAIQEAISAARKLADHLKARESNRVVFAESCTAGLVAGLLGQSPGISNFLCGSAVTYRESVKQKWLGVSAETLQLHTAESLETTNEMAVGVLDSTAEANFSAAVTGHLGPEAPNEIDGVIFVAVAKRNSNAVEIVAGKRFKLESESRIDRQFESAKCVFETLRSCF